MSAYQHREYSRFDPDSPDLRIGDCDGSQPANTCVYCGEEIEYGVECAECREWDAEQRR